MSKDERESKEARPARMNECMPRLRGNDSSCRIRQRRGRERKDGIRRLDCPISIVVPLVYDRNWLFREFRPYLGANFGRKCCFGRIISAETEISLSQPTFLDVVLEYGTQDI